MKQIGLSLTILTAAFIFCGILEMTLSPPPFVTILFFGCLGAMVGAMGWWYARAVRRYDSDDRRLAQYVDDRTPELQQRLITSMDSTLLGSSLLRQVIGVFHDTNVAIGRNGATKHQIWRNAPHRRCLK